MELHFDELLGKITDFIKTEANTKDRYRRTVRAGGI